jgi:tetratricopeptide (TPR) repeat protein
MHHRFLAKALIALLALFAAPHAGAMTADEYFADGNRLFREDLYWAALLRYRQAGEQGMDTPLLHYNTGIAHYRAGQHIRARESLLRALADPALLNAARYNLGLNAWALGDSEEALRWFRAVRDQQANEKLRNFAAVAISRIRAAQQAPSDYAVLVEEREEKRDFADLQLRARVGFGSDSNVFRSPDQRYIDRSDPDLPIVTPTVQSGTFIPVNLSARYQINSLPFEGFYGAYRLAGRYYNDELLENGNEYLHELSFGNEYEREEEGRSRRVHSAFAVARNDEVYYDPDDGAIRSAGGNDIDDRMNYTRYGPRLFARQSGEKLSFGISIKGELWDYEDTEVVPEYDHEYFAARLYGQYRFTRTSLLRVTTEYYSRRFGDRPSYDLDGQQRLGNPGVRYDYVALGLRARQRIFDNMWFGLEVEHTERTDQYVGYYDYTRDSFGFEFHWSPGRRFDIETSGVYHLYDYPNAFAFHDPTAARRTQESLDLDISATYHLSRHLSIALEAHHREVVSNDIRIQYDRTRYLIGVRWEQ